MPRRADWRPLEGAEKGWRGLRRWPWELVRSQEMLRLEVGSLAFASLPPTIAALALSIGIGLRSDLFTGLVWGALLVPGSSWSARALRDGYRCRRGLPSVLGRIVPLPLPDGTFPVFIVIRQGNALTGTDLAAASFVDGWLYVDGERTSFGLRWGEGQSRWTEGVLRIGLPDGQSISLSAVRDRTLGDRERAFEEAARRWIAEAARPQGESILPPRRTHPLMRRGWRAAATVAALFSFLVLRTAPQMGGTVSIFCGVPLAAFGALVLFRGIFVASAQSEADRAALAEEARAESPSGPRDAWDRPLSQ